MPILISNKGNLNGENPELENSPNYIINALANNYQVKINVTYHKYAFYLGENPTYKIPQNFLRDDNLWIQCNDLETLQHITFIHNSSNAFYIKNDIATITKSGIIWLNILSSPSNANSIIYLPETDWDAYKHELYQCKGICSNFIETIRNNQ